MLALTRKKGEALVINNNIEITVLEIRGDQIKIGISAPPQGSIFTDPAGEPGGSQHRRTGRFKKYYGIKCIGGLTFRGIPPIFLLG